MGIRHALFLQKEVQATLSTSLPQIIRLVTVSAIAHAMPQADGSGLALLLLVAVIGGNHGMSLEAALVLSTKHT